MEPLPAAASLLPHERHIFFHPLPINIVDQEVLEVLPGIGPALAARIVALRKELGSITRAEELLAVRGIGARKLEELRPWLSFARQNTSP